jgi:hypothetical protein
MIRKIVLTLVLLGSSGSSVALEQATAHVTLVQSTYMPTNIQFEVDTGTPSCPAGHWLTWANANVDNNKATYSTLLTAIAADKPVLYFVNNGDTGCTVIFLDITTGP